METRLLWKSVDSMAGASYSTHADHTEMMSVLSVQMVSVWSAQLWLISDKYFFSSVQHIIGYYCC